MFRKEILTELLVEDCVNTITIQMAGQPRNFLHISLKRLWTMRSLLTSEGLHEVLFASIAQKLARVFRVDFANQRIDSVHIQSKMRHLSCISLFVKTIKKHWEMEKVTGKRPMRNISYAHMHSARV